MLPRSPPVGTTPGDGLQRPANPGDLAWPAGSSSPVQTPALRVRGRTPREQGRVLLITAHQVAQQAARTCSRGQRGPRVGRVPGSAVSPRSVGPPGSAGSSGSVGSWISGLPHRLSASTRLSVVLTARVLRGCSAVPYTSDAGTLPPCLRTTGGPGFSPRETQRPQICCVSPSLSPPAVPFPSSVQTPGGLPLGREGARMPEWVRERGAGTRGAEAGAGWPPRRHGLRAVCARAPFPLPPELWWALRMFF